MKWLTIDYIKQHSRICCDCEDALLDLYGNAAEDTVLNIIDRGWADLVCKYGSIPNPIRQASLILVDTSYTQRSAVSAQNLYAAPYGFDMLVKPYMRLADEATTESASVKVGSVEKVLFSAALPGDVTLADVDFSVVVMTANHSVTFSKSDCISTDDDNQYMCVVDTSTLGEGEVVLVLTAQIPDTDTTTGYRPEIIRINPHITITR